ncbi:hypothetical protein OG828_47485 [Streptomyces sp. NBC_00457]|uniref:hypothetical protein n=1 Tax=Streptomyces sp. NBC_00457 TaxID=2975748 RepID=UPI002E22D65A
MRARAKWVLAAALGLAVATSTQAHADTTAPGGDAGVLKVHEMETEDREPGGQIRFNTNTDCTYVYDRQPDGLAAVGYVYEYIDSDTRGDLIYKLVNEGASDPWDPYRCAAHGGKYNLKEGRKFWFRICLTADEGPPGFCDWAAWRNVNT